MILRVLGLGFRVGFDHVAEHRALPSRTRSFDVVRMLGLRAAPILET